MGRALKSLQQAASTRKLEGERRKGPIRMRPPEITVLGMGSLTRASFTAQSLPPFDHFIIVPKQAACYEQKGHRAGLYAGKTKK
jgi:hypothetical protein